MKSSLFRLMIVGVCVLLSSSLGCSEEKDQTNDSVDRCVIENGKCGDVEYNSCTGGVGKEPTCTALDACAVENGGCGIAAYNTCTDGVGKEPTCTALDACAVENGGCGDGEDFLCTGEVGEAPTCTALNRCVVDNGGCGDANDYTCEPIGVDERVCRFVGDCITTEVMVEAEIAVTLNKEEGVAEDVLIIDRRGVPGWYEDNGDASEIYLRFDLKDVPEDMRINEAILQMTSFRGYAYGNNGNVYIHQIGNDWRSDSLSWESRPALLNPTPLGFWWAWYDWQDAEIVRQTNTPELATAINDAAHAVERKVSFSLYSIGYRSEYRTLADAEENRPQLILRDRRCFSQLLTATENVSVNLDSSAGENNSELVVEGERAETYLKFDLSSVHAGAKIVNARLTMVAFNGQGTGGDDEVFTTFVENDSWSQTSLTTMLTADSAYLGHWLLDYAVEPANENVEREVKNEHFGLIPLIQREFDDEDDQILSLRINSAEALSRYYSRSDSKAENHPRLLVTYELP